MLAFPICYNSITDTYKIILILELIKNSIRFFFLSNLIFFSCGRKNICKQDNIFCTCIDIKIQETSLFFSYLTSVGLSMQPGDSLTCPCLSSSRISYEASVPNICSVVESCPTLCNPLDYRPLCSSVPGIFQARILECVDISSSRGSSQFGGPVSVSCSAD